MIDACFNLHDQKVAFTTLSMARRKALAEGTSAFTKEKKRLVKKAFIDTEQIHLDKLLKKSNETFDATQVVKRYEDLLAERKKRHDSSEKWGKVGATDAIQ